MAQRLDAMMMALNGELVGVLLHGNVHVKVKVAIVPTICPKSGITRIAAPRMLMAIRSLAFRSTVRPTLVAQILGLIHVSNSSVIRVLDYLITYRSNAMSTYSFHSDAILHCRVIPSVLL